MPIVGILLTVLNKRDTSAINRVYIYIYGILKFKDSATQLITIPRSTAIKQSANVMNFDYHYATKVKVLSIDLQTTPQRRKSITFTKNAG